MHMNGSQARQRLKRRARPGPLLSLQACTVRAGNVLRRSLDISLLAQTWFEAWLQQQFTVAVHNDCLLKLPVAKVQLSDSPLCHVSLKFSVVSNV
jgi:hypothetical protein